MTSFLIVPLMKTLNFLLFLFYIAWDVIWLWCIKYCPEETHAYSQVFGLLNGLCEVVVNKEIKGLVQRSVKSCSQRKNYNKLTTFDRKKADTEKTNDQHFNFKKNWQNKGKWSILFFIHISLTTYFWKTTMLNFVSFINYFSLNENYNLQSKSYFDIWISIIQFLADFLPNI